MSKCCPNVALPTLDDKYYTIFSNKLTDDERLNIYNIYNNYLKYQGYDVENEKDYILRNLDSPNTTPYEDLVIVTKNLFWK